MKSNHSGHVPGKDHHRLNRPDRQKLAEDAVIDNRVMSQYRSLALRRRRLMTLTTASRTRQAAIAIERQKS